MGFIVPINDNDKNQNFIIMFNYLPILLLLLLSLIASYRLISKNNDLTIRFPRKYLKSSNEPTTSLITFELERLLTVTDFISNCKSLDTTISGVYAIENLNSSVEVVDASNNVYEDVLSYLNSNNLEFKDFTIRVQSFNQSEREIMLAYRDELIKQISPSKVPQSNTPSATDDNKILDVNDIVIDMEDSSEIVSPFADGGPADSEINEKKSSLPSEYVPLALTVENVDQVLNEIRPYLIADGGNVTVVSVGPEDRSIQLTLRGACGSCPSSSTTMKMGIEKLLKDKFINLGPITSIDPLLLESPTISLLKEVSESLDKIKPAVKAMGGVVEVKDVSVDTNTVYITYSGPDKLKKGIEMVLLDSILIDNVEFIDN